MQTKIIEFWRNGFVISSDNLKIDINAVYNFLTNSTPWARHITYQLVEKAVRNSLCFGIYKNENLIGFARLITDWATFAYLADVFIYESYRRKGLAKWLLDCIINIPELKILRRWLVATRNAHGLYAKFGFKPLAKPETFMEIYIPDIYNQIKTK